MKKGVDAFSDLFYSVGRRKNSLIIIRKTTTKIGH